MNSKTMVLVAASTCLLWASACGGDDEPELSGAEAEVAAVVDELGKAARSSDAKRICEDIFTLNLQVSIRRASGTSCGEEVGTNLFSEDTEFTVNDVTVSGDRADATVTDQEDRESQLVFEREGSDWRIARIG